MRLSAWRIATKLGPACAAFVPRLVRAFDAETEPEVLREALIAISTIGPEAKLARPSLIKELLASKGSRRLDKETLIEVLTTIRPQSQEVIDALSRCLADIDLFVRIRAAGAIREVAPDDLRAIDTLANCFAVVQSEDATNQYPVDKIRSAFRHAGKTATQLLSEKLQSGSLRQRICSAACLREVDPEFSSLGKHALLGALRDANPLVRQYAADALQNIREGTEECAKKLAVLLNDPDPGVREQTVMTLGWIGGNWNGTVDALTPLLDDSDREIRWLAANGLSNLRNHGCDLSGVSHRLLMKVRAEDPNVRAFAASALPKCKLDADAVVSTLIPLISDADSSVRTNAVSALGQMGASARVAVPELLKNALFKRSRGGVSRINAVEAVLQIDPSNRAALSMLMDDLSHPDDRRGGRHSFQEACGVVGRLGPAAPKEALETLRVSLKGKWSKRMPAAATLAQLDHHAEDSVKILVAALSVPDQRGAAAKAIAMLGEKAKFAIPALLTVCNGSDPFFRRDVVKALREIGKEDDRVCLRLLEMENDPDANVRFAAESKRRANCAH